MPISASRRPSRSIAMPLRLEPVDGLCAEDGAATLTAFTAASIARAREHFPEQPQLWVISGGGRRNKTLMAMIAGRVEAAVAPAEAAGIDGDAVEAEAWAYLAVRSLKGLPITFPGTTGVPAPLTGGVLATGAARHRGPCAPRRVAATRWARQRVEAPARHDGGRRSAANPCAPARARRCAGRGRRRRP